ncbi:MAG: hypothetical protein K0U66_10045 [Gammaproteobacteria bacterium]|nr:hypothetical protein [Gammaproteobacteria bacterium]
MSVSDFAGSIYYANNHNLFNLSLSMSFNGDAGRNYYASNHHNPPPL